ncbi:MAG TPA: hypothetical protein VMM13_03180 [Euzebya sp.]|nr:hypothetical protein [Euzebya sp.]
MDGPWTATAAPRALASVLARVLVALLVLALALALTACTDSPFAADPIPTVPEREPPPVPTLDQPTPTGEVAQQPPSPPASSPPPEAEGDQAATSPEPPAPTDPQAGPPTAVPQDPAELGRNLGVAGLADLLVEDPDLAGDRGGDLQSALRDIADRSGRSARRPIRDLRDQIPRWVEDGELDEGIGTAALAALDQAEQEIGPDRDDDDDDD